MESPWFRGEMSSDPMFSEEALRQRLAYCKARLTDIDNAPRHSRHRQDRNRVVSQIRKFESALERLRATRYGRRPPAAYRH